MRDTTTQIRNQNETTHVQTYGSCNFVFLLFICMKNLCLATLIFDTGLEDMFLATRLFFCLAILAQVTYGTCYNTLMSGDDRNGLEGDFHRAW